MLWRWGRICGRLPAQGLLITISQQTCAKTPHNVLAVCFFVWCPVKTVSLLLAPVSPQPPSHPESAWNQGQGFLMFSDSGTTPQQCLEGVLKRRSVGYASLSSCASSWCSVIIYMSVGQNSWFYPEGVRNVNVKECTHLSDVPSKHDFLQVSWQWFMQCSCSSSSASNQEKCI